MGRLSSGRLHPLATKHCLYSGLTSRMYGALPDDTICLFLSRMYEKALVVEYTGMFHLFLAWHHPAGCPFKPVAEAVTSEASQVANC